MFHSRKIWGYSCGVALFLLLFAAGCTELERSGYSAIPQNYPSSWEMNPYEDFQN